MTERMTIAMMTRVKLFLIIGRFPKKYPPKMKMPIQAMPPMML